jgi:hypothetical protein
MKRLALGHILGYIALTVILTAGAAQSLTGRNTVDSGDIIDGTISTSDLKTSAVSGSKILNNAVTGTDVDEASLVLTCPTGMAQAGDVCYGDERPPAIQTSARDDCADDNLRLPTLTEARLVTNTVDSLSELWTDYVVVNPMDSAHYGIGLVPKENWYVYASTLDWSYRCVTTVGSRP